MKTRKSVLWVILLCGCGGGPFLLVSGGKLDGAVLPTPASFSFIENGDTIQIETLPEKPYSVNVSSAIVGDDLYVNAGNSRSQWVQNIEVSPLVRARVRGDVYELKARRVSDAKEMDAVAEVWLARTTFARDPRKLEGEVWVYELEPR